MSEGLLLLTYFITVNSRLFYKNALYKIGALYTLALWEGFLLKITHTHFASFLRKKRVYLSALIGKTLPPA
jgi:hypothetical protein